MICYYPEKRANISASTVFRLARRFPCAISEDGMENLEEEILDYILVSPNELPTIQKETNRQTKSGELRTYWCEIDQLKVADNSPRFPNLCSLVKCLLSLPRSNAESERVFSIVRKILTDHRSQLDHKTVCSLL